MINRSIILFGLFFATSNAAYAQSKFQTYGDYPAAALAAGAQGTARYEILVGKDGRPKSCRITESTGHPDLDTSTCELMMQRGRFHPKRDEAGKPVEFTYTNQVRWRIPDESKISKSE
ncbi:TonB family protein [Sphingopyxis witflariensis]|uniref:TonB C-terminal domain-containing protein n=1 Tax=Sphingopyxis witflariensis TaxID=173675 RepID=A0A246K523_9SPHN|nr:TonB family protein [Sphingopyxis witflariensis]OWR01111.1 hypothetical protein CDQ91_01410 [Sphingopyxis witflariensis]